MKMNYILQPQSAVLDSDGLTTSAGWLVIYNVDANTGEYLSATYQYLPVGVGLPAHSYADAPKKNKADQAIFRQGDKWVYPRDYRGQLIYSTETGIESTVHTVGDIPSGFTMLKPSSSFDAWNGEAWVLDEEKKLQHEINKIAKIKKQLFDEATIMISCLQDAVDSSAATEQEVELLAKWKQYRVLINRVDINNLNWPEKPE